MPVCETLLNMKWQTVTWHRECEQSVHVQQSRGLGLGGGSKAKTLSSRTKAKDLHEVSSRPRPSLEDNKTGKRFVLSYECKW